MKAAGILLVCLLFCSCGDKTDWRQLTPSRMVQAEVLSASMMHDNHGDAPHEMSRVVKYRILGPPDVKGREVTMFYPVDRETNTTVAVGATVDLEVVEAQLEPQTGK